MKVLCFLLPILLLCGCASQGTIKPAAKPEATVLSTPAEPEPSPPPAETSTPTLPQEPTVHDPIRQMISDMSLEQRVGQLFLARCNRLSAEEDIARYHLGGLILFGDDFKEETPDSMRDTIRRYQRACATPLLIAVDEEGGDVTRISRFSAFRNRRFSSLRVRYAQGGLACILEEEQEKNRLLDSLGINVNLGPVCDITTQKNAFLYSRSLGLDAQTTSDTIQEIVSLMANSRIGSVLKHFPGYGNNSDTHTGIVVDKRPLTTLESCDLLPFSAGIQAGCDAIMVGHIIVEALDAQYPASLSPDVHKYLRETMGFSGVIMTDDLVMQAISDQYGAGEAAVLAVLAGNDLLCATDYATQYEAVLKAVLDGRIDIDVLNSAVRNVLEWKIRLGLIDEETNR